MEILVDLIPHSLLDDLKKNLSFTRLAKAGLFRKLENSTPQIQPEILLHRSVLDRALMDMFSPFESIRKDVEEWLDLDNESFAFCCERANLDYKSVYKIFIIIKEIFKDERINDNS